jgi:PIN domain nuclease of toxin-antitoxin system
MLVAVADTHAIIWYVRGDRRLTAVARQTIDGAVQAGDEIGLSSISLIEIVYLVEKGRVVAQAMTDMRHLLDMPNPFLKELPVDRSISEVLDQIPRAPVPDMPDRIIAATAPHFGVPVISRDRRINISNPTTIW